MLTLAHFQRYCSQDFIKKLHSLELENRTISEFRDTLEELHTSFLRLREAFSYRHPAKATAELINVQGDICRYKIDRFVLLTDGTDNPLVIGTDDSSSDLESKFVNLSLSEAARRAVLYSDYDTRRCNACGRYFILPHYALPIERVECLDFVLSLHTVCRADIPISLN